MHCRPNFRVSSADRLLLHCRLCSLRLEAGLCLYGNDIENHITPVEAGLTWTIGKARRETMSMLGGEVLRKQIAEGVDIRRVGFVTTGAPSRQHCKITTLEGEEVRKISSLKIKYNIDNQHVRALTGQTNL